MTSLHPGLLFYSTGLNKKSTPNGPEASPSEIDRKLGRAPFNGRPWPRPSPVSSVYDVRNSSTRMIILNNKLSRRAKGSRLRGQTDHNGEIQAPEPERHLADTKPHTNWEHHKQCAVSISEKFMPIPAPTTTNNMPEWVNKTQRPAMKFDNGSGVNPNHHIQCQGHMDYDIIRWYNAQAHSRRVGGGGQSRSSSRADGGSKSGRALSPVLNGPGLSRGERRYLNSIAKIYSVDNMRQQVQVQYNRLMWKEISKGCYKDGEWEKYQRYLNTPRKTQFGPCDPFREKRSISAPGINNLDDSRPQTSQTSQTSQRGTARKPASRNLTAPAGANRKGKGVGKARPVARKESPLPPPQERKGSTSSLSSLEEEEESKKQANNESADKPKRSEIEEKPAKAESSPKELTGADDDGGNKTRADDPTARATANIGVEEEDDVKNKSGDAERVGDGDDERSKLSARGPSGEEEQRGGAVEYRTNVSERQDERETLSDRDTYTKPSPIAANEKSSSKLEQEEKRDTQPYGEITEQPSVGLREERSTSGSDRRPSRASNEDDGGESAKKETKVGSRPASSHYSKADSEIYVPLQKTSETSSVSAPAAANQQDNAELMPSSQHKEGKDRPLSRLGGREQFMVVKTDRENSDDDYSDDDGDVSLTRNKTAASTQESQTSEQKDAGQGGPDNANSSHARISSSPAAAQNAETSAGSKPEDYREQSSEQASTQEKPSDISTVEY